MADELLRDPGRLATLRRAGLLDRPPEPSFERFTRLACALLGVPVSLVSLVDADRQYFAAQRGLAEPWASEGQTPLTHSFCQYVVASGEELAVADARLDPRLHDNLAIPELGVVAYAGEPLVAPDGARLGAFCAIDSAPRAWTEAELAVLRDLAAAVNTELRLRLSVHALQELAVMASHELRTPLTNIAGYAELLATGEAGPLVDEQREYTEIIRRNADRLDGQVTALIDGIRSQAADLGRDTADV